MILYDHSLGTDCVSINRNRTTTPDAWRKAVDVVDFVLAIVGWREVLPNGLLLAAAVLVAMVLRMWWKIVINHHTQGASAALKLLFEEFISG